MRNIICHYHIYKNSGTSFDSILKANYGDKHICFDGPFPFFSINQTEFESIINRHPNIVAFSSHQIKLPVPSSLKFNVLPVIFIRHPILRIYSIYKFKRKTKDGTSLSKLAIANSFNNWVTHCFDNSMEITHVSNAQTRIISAVYDKKPIIGRRADAMEYDINQALRNLSGVELLGRTEMFDGDVQHFPKILKKHGIAFQYINNGPKNVTNNDIHLPLDERIHDVVEKLSQTNTERLQSANTQDMRLFDYATQQIESS
ncbi:MAG: sulfotransferase family 2 domain-containing protein [Gammaproteobacteria bacterium]|nr:sulfotransferase family 2 domain-containing protein [Gammaproteobacteria bacterium]